MPPLGETAIPCCTPTYHPPFNTLIELKLLWQLRRNTREGGTITTAAGEDHNATLKNEVMPPLPITNLVMVLGLSAPIPPRGVVSGIGGGAGRAGIALEADPRASEELSAFQACLRIANTRLLNLDYKAMQINALPCNHPEHSPSSSTMNSLDCTHKNTREKCLLEKYIEVRTIYLKFIALLDNDIVPLYSSPIH